MYEFNYHKPASLADVQSSLAAASDGKLMAGGQTLIPTLKQRLASPSDVIDLSGVGGLTGIRKEGNAVVIGALTCHADVAVSEMVNHEIPALAMLAQGIGDPQVRNRGTIGGSVANNDPAADYPAAVLGLGATIHTNQRSISGDDFFDGMFETVLKEDEIVTSLSFPIPDGAAYSKFPNPASRYAIVGVFVAKIDSGVRVAVTGAGSCVFRHTEAEQALSAQWSPNFVPALPSAELNEDIHASSAYRAHLVGVMTRRAVASFS